MHVAIKDLVLCILLCSHSKKLARDFCLVGCKSGICVLLERSSFQKTPLLPLVFCKCKHLVAFKGRGQQ